MKNLSWTEPTAYRRAIFRDSRLNNPWKHVGIAVVIFAGVIGFRAYQDFVQNNRAPSWTLATAIAVAAALFFAYFLPWLQVLLPSSIVIFSEKGVNNNIVNGRGAGVRFFPWSNIGRVVATTVALEGETYPVIALYSPDDQHLITLGLKRSPTLDQLAEYLEQHEVELHRESSIEQSE